MKRFLYTLLLFTLTGIGANAQAPGGALSDAELRSKPYVTNIQEALKKPGEVYRLAVDVTGMRRLPQEIHKLPNLQAVAIYGDKSSIDWELVVTDLQEVDKLKALAIDGNGLEEIPFPIFRLVRLTSFEFNNAPITALPEALFKLKNLTTLIITDTDLSIVPPSISRLSKLEYLYLKRNKIERLPGTIAQIPNLKTLSIDSNYITSIPSAFKTMGKLESLSLSGNKLSDDEMSSVKHNLGDKVQAGPQQTAKEEPAKEEGKPQGEEVKPENSKPENGQPKADQPQGEKTGNGQPETPAAPEDQNNGEDYTETPQ
jgi:hypothetical protein